MARFARPFEPPAKRPPLRAGLRAEVGTLRSEVALLQEENARMASQNREFLELVHGLMEDRQAGGDGLALPSLCDGSDDAADRSSRADASELSRCARRLRVVQAVLRKAVRCACVGAARLDWLVGRHLAASAVSRWRAAAAEDLAVREAARATRGAAARRVVARRANRAVGAAFRAWRRASAAPRGVDGVARRAWARAALDLGSSYYLGEAQERRERDDDDGTQPRRHAARRDDRRATPLRRTRRAIRERRRERTGWGAAAALAEELTAVSRDWAGEARQVEVTRWTLGMLARWVSRPVARAWRRWLHADRRRRAAAAARSRRRRARLGRALRAWRRGACFAAAAADAARSRAAALSRHLRKCLARWAARRRRGTLARAWRALLARGAPRVALDAADAAAL
ncbi:hypothetical protein AURANDRAFT_69300, partial [Aureococcus anophagefferens]